MSQLIGGLEEEGIACRVVTPYGLVPSQSLIKMAIVSGSDGGRDSWLSRLVKSMPRTLRVVLGDIRALFRARRFARESMSLDLDRPDFVLQFHARFHDAGVRLAKRSDVPLVMKLDALEVREEAAWGVRRPRAWSWLVERIGELRILRRADVLLPVSEEVASQLALAGLQDRVHVLMNAVDSQAFRPASSDTRGQDGVFTVGWIGTFRPFHGLELLAGMMELLRECVPGSRLCLVGAGPMLEPIRRSLAHHSDVVTFLGPVPYMDVPQVIRGFDVDCCQQPIHSSTTRP
jgi:glycosyltransferase involved in cell wall biosynthesis